MEQYREKCFNQWHIIISLWEEKTKNHLHWCNSNLIVLLKLLAGSLIISNNNCFTAYLLFVSPLMQLECSSGSVELDEVCDRASSVARDWSMLSRLLEVGNCRYFSGT